MPQHDMDIADQAFPAFRADMILAFKALVSQNQGSSAPSTTFAYMPWLDTSATPWVMKIRNAANDAWITTYEVDDSDDSWNIPLATSVNIADAGGFYTGTQVESALQELGSLQDLAALSIVAGDTVYASATDTWARLAKGTDGEVLTLASGIPSWATTATLMPETAATTTSGTAHGFTGIAAGTNRITFILQGVSLSGSDELLIQIGDAGGYETTGYVSSVSSGSDGSSAAAGTSGFLINRNSGSGFLHTGSIVLHLIDGTTWISSGLLTPEVSGGNNLISLGRKALSAELDRIQLITSGSDTFDAGKINIFTE